MKKSIFNVLIVCVLLLTSCQNEDYKKQIDYLPFKVSSNDNWGLIGLNGKILFENEFKSKPSIAVNGIFKVENQNGEYELYKAEKKPQQIGNKSYLNVGYFFENITPAVEKNSPISYIDKNGKIIFTFNKHGDYQVEKAYNFRNGLSRFYTSENKYGYVNTKGKIVISPIYDEGYDFSENVAIVGKKDDSGHCTYYVIDKSGKIVSSLKLGDIKIGFDNNYCFKGGLLPYCDENIYGYINKVGEKIIKANDKYRYVTPFEHQHAFYSDDSGTGLINHKGDIVIRAKYDELAYSNLFMYKHFACFKRNDKYGFVDFDGNEICTFEFDEIIPFLKGKTTFARINKYYSLIDINGKAINNNEYAVVDFDIDEIIDNEYIVNDYFDIKSITSFIRNINVGSIATFTLGDKLSDFIKSHITDSDINELEFGEWDYDRWSNTFSFEESKRDISIEYVIHFSETAMTPIEKTVSTNIWGIVVQDKKVVGYNVNEQAMIDDIAITLSTKQKSRGKEKMIYETLINQVKSSGYEKRGNQYFLGKTKCQIKLNGNDIEITINQNLKER